MVSSSAALLVCALVSSGETALYEFKADWCAPCRQMSGVVQDLSTAGYPVHEVDVERDRATTERFGVGPLPCFVLVVNGQEVDRVVGLVNQEELQGMFARAGVRPDAQGGLTEVAKRTPLAAPVQDPFAGQQSQPPQQQQPQQPLAAPAGGAQDLLAVSARLRIEDATGQSFGSGTVIDSRNGEALIITCGHVFRESQGKGKITVDLFGPAGLQGLPGQVIGYDLDRDLGFIAIRPGTDVPAAPLARRNTNANVGDAVCSVGCNGGADATVMNSQVTAIDKYLGPPNIQASGLPVQGRSGGGLFNAGGELIGVCNAADPEDQEGLYAALGAIYAEVDRLQLASIVEHGNAEVGVAATSSAVRPASFETPAPPPATANWDAAEMSAALADHQGAEVICIVRSLRDPRAKSNVIVLDRASPDFLAKLTAEQSVQDNRHPTADRRPAKVIDAQLAPWRPAPRTSRKVAAPAAPRR